MRDIIIDHGDRCISMGSYNCLNNAYRGGTQTSQREQELSKEASDSHARSVVLSSLVRVYDLKTLNLSNSASEKPAEAKVTRLISRTELASPDPSVCITTATDVCES